MLASHVLGVLQSSVLVPTVVVHIPLTRMPHTICYSMRLLRFRPLQNSASHRFVTVRRIRHCHLPLATDHAVNVLLVQYETNTP